MKAYLHIPFCASRCSYCDFHTGTNRQPIDDFVQALRHELQLRSTELPPEDALDTVYFGGGTPSQLSPRQLSAIIEDLYGTFPIDTDAEITFEANPDDLTTDYIEHLAQQHINRISLGVQSLQDDELRSINRRHDARTAMRVLNQIRKAGISNISIDLIYGLPAQTLQTWTETLDKTLDLRPPHISAYHLIYEEGTPLYRSLSAGHITPVDEDTSIKMFDLLIDKLTDAGYEQYEISNFALPGYRSKHNAAYWQGLPYLGFGPSAHSYDGANKRCYNQADTEYYIQSIRSGSLPIVCEELSVKNRYNEAIMCGLRTSDGLYLSRLRGIAPQYIEQTERLIAIHEQRGWLSTRPISGEEPDKHIRLTRSGLFVSDSVMADLFVL